MGADRAVVAPAQACRGGWRERGKLRGMVQEVDLLRHLVQGSGTLESTISELVESDYANFVRRVKPDPAARTREIPTPMI